ncbi:MAG: hypothetical protein IJX83_14275 [Lachnospiraceae bacterium]|nr:hypothetical protein [Lachnospiraceae bacterium]
MDDLHLKQTEKRCFSVLSGTTKNSEEFMDSPTFFLSRATLRDRLWLLIFLEALIAIENGSEEYFETDYILAVNEYLVRRSDLSVRMLNTWIGGQNFRSMQEVTDFFNDRYRVTGQFFRDNQLLCRREWQEAASVYRARWIEAVRAQEDIPQELVPYDTRLGERKFRENPVQYLLGIREEERLHFIALIAECIYEYELAAGKNVAVRSEKTGADFVRDFGNLLNTYIKYPEDPEIQTLTLMVHMDMNSKDFRDDVKRRAFFNEYLRSVAYKWHTNTAGCRKAVTEKWEEYGPLFRHLPQDGQEPGVPELYLDEAVLNIPEFQKEPLRFLRQQMKREQTIHFLTMLHASSGTPENSALAAYLITRWLLEPEQEYATEMDSFFGWDNRTDEERNFSIEQEIRDLLSVWRYNYKKCRNTVKADWAVFEEAYGHVIADNVVLEDLQSFADIFENSDFIEDPISILRDMDREEIERFVDFCGALNGMDEHDAAVFAEAAITWLENPSNDGARQLIDRIGGWKAAGVSGEISALRDFFEKSAVSWRFNYGGLRSNAVYNRKNYFRQLSEHKGENRTESARQELKSFDRIMEDEHFIGHPVSYLRGMSQLQCERFLMFLAASSGMDPDSALRFAVIFKNAIFYPNDGLRKRVDKILGRRSRDDRQRTGYIEELLRGSVKESGLDADKRKCMEENWSAYAKAFDDRREKQKKNHWELSELNVRKLFRYCTTGKESASTVRPEDEGTVVVKLLGSEEPVDVSFRDVALSTDRIYSDQVGEILRFMLGQLEMFHLRGENRNQRTYPVTYPVDRIRVRRDAYGDKIQWTDSESTVCQLLYLAVGAELLPPIHQSVNDRTGEVALILKLDEAGADKIETILRSI